MSRHVAESSPPERRRTLRELSVIGSQLSAISYQPIASHFSTATCHLSPVTFLAHPPTAACAAAAPGGCFFRCPAPTRRAPARRGSPTRGKTLRRGACRDR